MGDPAGVGPEVALRALVRVRQERLRASFLLVGSFDRFREVSHRLRIPLPLEPLRHPRQLAFRTRGVPVLDLGGPRKAPWGRVSAACGAAAVRYVKVAGLMAREGVLDGLVTAPLNKEAIHRAGCDFPGHTEMLASLAGTKRFAMMMAGGPFRIVLLTIHTSLRDAIRGVTRTGVLDRLDLTVRSLREQFGIRRPRIAVAGLNPHAGENGAFGREEIRILAPAVREARRRGWDVTGPHPPDTLFHWAAKGRFDAVLALYHDQGLIPFKLAVFDEGVNVTLGLPFVRTSPDHGTAFDIAGKGKADPSSMAAALRLAVRMVRGVGP